MIVDVETQLILLNGDSTAYRVKRRTGPNVNPVIRDQHDTKAVDAWYLDPPAEPYVHYIPDGRDYVPAFWSFAMTDMASGLSNAWVTSYLPSPSISTTGGMWKLSAKLYYVWSFGAGGGPNAVQIDAFDIQLRDFIPDDFVDVTPDDAAGTLTASANNGYIDTSAQIPANVSGITIAARDVLPSNKQFANWINVATLQFSADPKHPSTVGFPDRHDIVAHSNDIVVAFAFYNELGPRKIRLPTEPPIYDPWWWIITRGGLIGPGPEPWRTAVTGLAALGIAANAVSPQLKKAVLELALKQNELIRQGIEGDLR